MTTKQLFILLVIQSSTKEPNTSKLIVISFVNKVESKDIVTPYVPSGSQLADIFTKALPKNAIDFMVRHNLLHIVFWISILNLNLAITVVKCSYG